MVLYTSSFFTCELIRISKRLVFVSHGFSFSRSRSLADAFHLPVVWSLNAKFEPDRDKADKSAKLCIQFSWDMSMKSEMGAQEKKTCCYRIKWEILLIIVLLCLVTTLFLTIVFATVLKGKMAQNQCKDFPE